MVKNLSAMQVTWVQSLGQEGPAFLLGKPHGQREPCGLQSMGLQRVSHSWATNTHFFHCKGASLFKQQKIACRLTVSNFFLLQCFGVTQHHHKYHLQVVPTPNLPCKLPLRCIFLEPFQFSEQLKTAKQNDGNHAVYSFSILAFWRVNSHFGFLFSGYCSCQVQPFCLDRTHNSTQISLGRVNPSVRFSLQKYQSKRLSFPASDHMMNISWESASRLNDGEGMMEVCHFSCSRWRSPPRQCPVVYRCVFGLFLPWFLPVSKSTMLPCINSMRLYS